MARRVLRLPRRVGRLIRWFMRVHHQRIGGLPQVPVRRHFGGRTRLLPRTRPALGLRPLRLEGLVRARGRKWNSTWHRHDVHQRLRTRRAFFPKRKFIFGRSDGVRCTEVVSALAAIEQNQHRRPAPAEPPHVEEDVTGNTFFLFCLTRPPPPSSTPCYSTLRRTFPASLVRSGIQITSLAVTPTALNTG